jgi:hypothetical protein
VERRKPREKPKEGATTTRTEAKREEDLVRDFAFVLLCQFADFCSLFAPPVVGIGGKHLGDRCGLQHKLKEKAE